jgi:undecaprenyl-diphosphatase
MGALASATSVLPRRYKLSIWAIALGLSGTRVAILAHWLSDVVAGFVIGVAIERGLRPLTGYPDRHLRAVAYDGRDT